MNKSVRKALRASFFLLQSLLLLIFVLLLLLQSSSVQNFVVNSFLLPKGSQISLTGFRGFFPSNVYYKNIKLTNNGAPQLDVKSLTLDVGVLKTVLSGGPYIENLAADKVVYYDIEGKSTKTKSPSFDFELPAIPSVPFVVVEKLNLGWVEYIQKNTSFKYKVEGATVKGANGGFSINFGAENLITASNSINVKGHSDPSLSLFNIKALVNEDKGGLLSHLLANDKVFALTLSVSSKEGNVSGDVSLNVDKIMFSGKANAEQRDDNTYELKTFGEYKDAGAVYDFKAAVNMGSSLNEFKIQQLHVSTDKGKVLEADGLLKIVGSSLIAKKLNTQIVLSPDLVLLAQNSFSLNAALPRLTYQLSGSAQYDNKEIGTLSADLLLDKRLKNSRFSFSVDSDLTSLNKELGDSALINLSGKLDPKAVRKNKLRLPIKLTHKLGSANAELLYEDGWLFNIDGSFLSNTFSVNAALKNDNIKLTAKNTAGNVKQRVIPVRLSADFSLSEMPKLRLDHNVILDGRPVDVNLQAVFSEDYSKVAMTHFKAQHKESFVEAKGSVFLDRMLAEVDWQFYSFNLGDLVDGKVSGTLSTVGRYEFDGVDSLVNFKGDFHKLVFGAAALKKGTMSGFINLSKNSQLNFDLNAKHASLGEVLIEDFSVNTNGALDNFSTTLSMVGYAEQALKGNMAFSVVNLSRLDLESLLLNLGKNKLVLNAPASITYSDQNLKLSPLTLSTDRGEVSFLGELLNDELDFAVHVKNVSGELLNHLTLGRGRYILRGVVNSQIKIGGTLSKPTMNLEFQSVLDSDQTRVVSSYSNESLSSSVSINTDRLKAHLEAAVPLLIDFKSGGFLLKKEAPLRGLFKADGRLEDLNRVLSLSADDFYGGLTGNLALSGSFEHPLIAGSLTLDGGGYKKDSVGLHLKEVGFSLMGGGPKISLKAPVTFTDTGKGIGFLDEFELGFAEKFTPVLNTKLRFEKIQFVDIPQTRNGGMSIFASGILRLTGPFSALNIYLRGDIDTFEKYIGSTDSVPIYKVNAYRKKPQSLEGGVNSDLVVLKEKTPSIFYDVELRLNNKFRIFGLGLDSSWKGTLGIKGNDLAPIYKGAFALREGEVRILDKLFNVQKGRVEFDGDLSPTLYVEAGLALPDIRVSIILEGEDDKITQRITSDQDLTEQEILQRLFFNRSSTLSQSLQVLNLLASQSFISSLVDVGFYQETNPITHKDHQYLSLKRRLFSKSYVNVDVGINNDDGLENKVSLSTGYNFNKSTKAKVNYAPGEKRVGVSLEWEKDF